MPTNVTPDPVSRQYMTEALKNAYLNGDFNFIDKCNEALKKDMEPIADLFNNHEHDEVFNIVKDDDGNDVAVVTSQDATFFTQVKENPDAREAAKKEGKEDPHMIYNPTTKVGYYSKNGQKAETTFTWIVDHIPDVTILVLSTTIGYVAGNMITKSLTGNVTQAGIDAAVKTDIAFGVEKAAQEALGKAVQTGDKTAIAAAEAALKKATEATEKAVLTSAEHFIQPGKWAKFVGFLKKWPKVTGGVVGTLVMVVSTILLEFIWGKINKDFWLQVEIYNFDPRTWKVDDWYHDNGIVAGGGPFTAVSLPGPTSEVKFPWEQATKGLASASGVTYTFQNSFTVLDGVGIALRTVQADEHTGFALGYIIKALTDNRLTLKAGAPSSIKDFYDDEKNWPSDKPMKAECVVPLSNGASIKVVAHTDALGGKDDHVYRYFLVIGA